MQPYSSEKWKTYRKEVIRLDGNQCVRCGRTASEGAVLQVHHKYYIPNRMPWEYPHDACEAICKRCHAEEHGKILPSFGWKYLGDHDREDLTGSCDNCSTAIRYEFLIFHPKWGFMEVGEICCDNLTSTSIASNHMESVRRYNGRRKRFVDSSRWVLNRSGNLHIRQQKITAEIIVSGSTYKLQMNGRLGKLTFDDITEAKMIAFDSIESGKVANYLAKQQAVSVARRSPLR